jgi:diguanylate cyclase (GGDEF)-like protein
MKILRIRRPGLFVACAAVATAQAVIICVRPHATLVSNSAISIGALLACLGCWNAARRSSKETRRLWILFATAFFVSTVGQIAATYHEQVTSSAIQTNAFNFDFLFFAYGIPILLAICSGAETSSLKAFLWIDGAQALVGAMLAYLEIFSQLPSFGGSTNGMYLLYCAENWILVGAATIRLYSNPHPAARKFFETLTIYLLAYALIATVVGYFELIRNVPDSRLDIAWTIPYVVLLGVLAMRRRVQEKTEAQSEENQSVGLLINNLSPVIFTLTIVLMGIVVAQKHPLLALTCISIAVALYGLRAAILQGMYLRTQAELTGTAYSLIEANDRLLSLSSQDGLTGIHNRRHFDEVIMREWKVAARSQQALSLLMIDVDCFKALNDHYGHQEGDNCLRSIAANLQAKLKRPSDLVARYGGEEFVVVLPGSDLNGAIAVAEEIRESVAGLALPNEASLVEKVVTVSVGVSSKTPSEESHVEDLINSADRALYRAKANGRNQSRADVEFAPMAAACV